MQTQKTDAELRAELGIPESAPIWNGTDPKNGGAGFLLLEDWNQIANDRRIKAETAYRYAVELSAPYDGMAIIYDEDMRQAMEVMQNYRRAYEITQ